MVMEGRLDAIFEALTTYYQEQQGEAGGVAA